MPSTHSSLHAHIVFSTKHREAHLMPSIRDRVHEYLGGTIKGLGAVSNGVGGYHDHVHLLIGFKPVHSLSVLMREIKSSSSAWIKKEMGNPSFAWQEGFGAFTFSAPDLEAVQKYVANQEEHHRGTTYQEEYRAMLERGLVDYHEDYLW